MGFQFTLQHSILTFDEIERANQGHWLFQRELSGREASY